MIRVENLKFKYEKEPVLQKVSFEEKQPVVTGLWGRNGSGKTTLMKLLAGHEKPNRGTVYIQGEQPYNSARAVQNLCFMQEEHPFSSIWDVGDAIRFGRYYNPNWDQEMAEELLKTFRLDVKKKISKLSKGMKSALQFIIGISSQADITILDEPINGLDAGMRKKLYDVLRESHEKNPRLILLSTHHIEEVQPICESLAVMDRGQIILHETMDDVREKGIWLSGESETLEDLLEGETILEKKQMNSVMKVMIDAPYTEAWKEFAYANGLSIEKAQLQDYLLNRTEEVEEMDL